MKFLDANDPFFRPVWRRWVAALVPLVWGGFELASGNSGWGFVFLTAGVYAFVVLIVRGPSGSE